MKKLGCFISFLMLLFSPFLFAGSAFAAKTNELETLIYSQLDRMFFSEQYILDFQERIIPQEDQQNKKQYLPGLSAFSTRGETSFLDSSGKMLQWPKKESDKIAYDVFLAFDKSVNRERRRLAEKLIRRIFALRAPKALIRIELTQASILKLMPEELKESLRPLAPISSQAPSQTKSDKEDNWDEEINSDTEDLKTSTVAANATPTPVGDNTQAAAQALKQPVSENNSSENSLTMRDLLVAGWGLFISAGLLFVLFKKYAPQQAPLPYYAPPPSVADGKEVTEKNITKENKRNSKTIIKERQLLQFREEVIELCSQNPEGVASILSGWIGESAEGAGNSRLILQNCKVSTLISISKYLSPSEIGAVFNKKIEEFDPMSRPNILALERLRGALALHASGNLEQEEKGSLAFLKKLSPEQLVDLLRDESIESIAYVATQVSPVQLANILRGYSEKQLSAITAVLSATADLSEEKSEKLRWNLFEKLKEQQKNTKPSERSISKTVLQFLSVTAHPHKQITIAKELYMHSPSLYTRARENILLPYDLDNLSEASSKLIASQIEAETLAISLGQLNYPFEKLTKHLPPTYQTIFSEELTIKHTDNEREKAWKQVKASIQELLDEGIMSETDLMEAKTKSLLYELELIDAENRINLPDKNNVSRHEGRGNEAA